ncbi:MAG: hypothetical protein HY687_01305 [Chloroflexi bacterium]|nr:hypothetical protein [Chloroflexota bacterium]
MAEPSSWGRVLETYFTGRERLPSVLQSLDKDELKELVHYLLDSWANDLNSSTLRELITLIKAGYTPRNKKLGPNGTSGSKSAEVKPVNIRSDSTNKLNGGGNFSDLTPESFERRLAENLTMLVSGFVDGELGYILEFPFSHNSFTAELKRQLDKRFPGGRRPKGQYNRSTGFSFIHYQDCRDLKVIFVTPHLDSLRSHLTRQLYDFLKSRSK